MPWSGRVMAAGLLALSLGVPAASAAQREIRPPGGEFTCYPDKPGTFQYRGSTDALTFGITAPQARTFLGHLEAMRDIVRAAPVFNPLLGVDAYDVHADFCCPWDCQRDKSCRSRPVHGRLVVFLHYWMSNGPGRTPFTQVEERSEFELHVNRTILLESGAFPVLEDGRRPGYAPQPWREVNGATLVRYHSDYDLYVVLTHGKRPLQIPVTREQYLRAVIRDREKEQRKAELDWDRAAASLPVTQQGQLREVRSKLASVREMMVGQLQRQLDQMSPAERASQAWVR
ncbi:MAG TPA: hypothetical protein VEA99_15075, partial [Gemmatimonadaceae bacterium]|nr:hypothetical protein [Gemmatimonadaceae bacterium]